MDQIHTRAIEALQPFIHLANSNSATSPRFIANLITNATSNPHTYVFAELLETPTIQALRSPTTPAEFQGYLTLLEIFAWGTWQDYQTTPNLPSLSAEQALKLRLLSLLTLSATLKPLTYKTLMDALAISAPADLESLVTKAIYSSLITARLSPASNPPFVNVTSVAPLRDIKPQSLPTMISLLTEWESRCGDVISDIEAEIAKIKSNAAKRRAKEQARAALLEKALASADGSAKDAAVGGPGSRKLGGAQRFGQGGGNKREFNADDYDDEDDGYWDNGNDGGIDLHAAGSRMDIDESAGSSRFGLSGAGARHAKRILGKKS
ncbi:COP9 signalosome complex subunit 7 [Aspergillus lentulus]|uniref:COP9 signalosome complex subunit 7 n=1 Tax=Aspergillus lentulus TaxID=293939 RepID=A0AAN4PLT7_ASPLE|nr:COP9 signalosome complex subunit 7 [Aspergillus lentulus]GAQ08383.1 COP9 signalosome complex subunit 7 [Aspergillus lentulus]GFF22910.1 COP9 signalosome complex subunit 7 [Aspergillus lentulus]GFF60984.1 COP9 signalosome complex subunit 7 [Aspergillus lentulus]GFF62516.1 COP9 signalosome complex subunit 7 [Aspergillus lentulus]GFF64022.1 COP9 signalosome complex subunit 7 [Aspergillus lentulus]